MGRTCADLLDKHYALFAQNQHPLQLVMYEEHNKFLRMMNDEEEIDRKIALADRMREVQKERESALATEEGETINADDMKDIYIQVMGEHREASKFRTRDKHGNINDDLEQRRPFGATQ